MPKQIKYPRLRSHVRKAKSGNVRVYYFYDMRPDGLPDVPLGRDYEEAIEKWRELHEHKPRAKGRIQEAIDKWRKSELPSYPVASTRRDYARQLMRIELAYGQCAWDEVDLPSLYAYIDARTAKTQANRELSVFSIVWHKAQLWGMTRLLWPAAGVRKWKHVEQQRTFIVTDDLFNAVYTEADLMLRDAMDIATATGMRLTDVRTVRMPVGDLLRMKASKTGKDADFDVSVSMVLPELIARRRAIKADHVMLLSTQKGEPVTASMLRGAWERARSKAAENNPALADQIKQMYLRDMRKRASNLAASLEQASALLQHSGTALTAKHYRTEVAQLKPVR